MTEKTWDDLTREERVALLLQDSDAYIDLVPEEHWILLLDGVEKIKPD